MNGVMERIVESGKKVIESWDDRSCGEKETQKTLMGTTFWSPSASMVDASAIHDLRSALVELEKPATVNDYLTVEKPAEDAISRIVEDFVDGFEIRNESFGISIPDIFTLELTAQLNEYLDDELPKYIAKQCAMCKAVIEDDVSDREA